MNANKTLSKLIFFNLLFIFIYPSFGSENFDECVLLTNEIKKNIHSYQLDEAPNEANEDGRPLIWFKTDTKYNSSSDIRKIGHIDGVISEDVNVLDFPFERTSRNMIKILSIHSYYSNKYKIIAGDIVYSINDLEISNLTDSDIRNLIIDEMEILKEGNNTELIIFNNKEDLKTEYFSVSAGIFPKTISDIDPVNGTFNSSYKIILEWGDFRLINIGKNVYEERNKNFPELEGHVYFCTYTEKEFLDLGLWQPKIGLKNEVRNLNLSKKIYVIEFFHEDSNGNGIYITKKYEGASNLKSNFVFNSFPFDSQKIEFVLNDISADKYNHYIWFSEAYYLDLIRNFNNISLTDWTLASFDINHTSDPSFLWEQQFSDTANKENLHFIYDIERNYFYYIYKILIPILIILLISWSTFWISIKELESRLTVSVVCFLSLIAYTFVIDQSLPKLDYLTIMDKIVLLAYVFSALPTIQSIYAHSLYIINPRKSIAVNNSFKKITPIMFIVVVFLITITVLYNSKNTIYALSY